MLASPFGFVDSFCPTFIYKAVGSSELLHEYLMTRGITSKIRISTLFGATVFSDKVPLLMVERHVHG
jgi:NADH:ubiquinone oxidoreductase subunit